MFRMEIQYNTSLMKVAYIILLIADNADEYFSHSFIFVHLTALSSKVLELCKSVLGLAHKQKLIQ